MAETKPSPSDSVAYFVVMKCGGFEAVATMLGITVTSVYRWTYGDGNVPVRRQKELIAEARKRGINLQPRHFFKDLPSLTEGISS